MKIIIIPNNTVMAARHYSIASTLESQGHEIHYMAWALPYKTSLKELVNHLFTSLIPKQYMHENVTVHKVRRLPYFWPYINGLLFKKQIRKLYKQLDADIIFTESYTNETEVPKDLPFIYDLADDYAAPPDVYGSPIYKLAFKLLGVRNVMVRQCKNAVAVTAVSEVLCKFAEDFNDNVVKLPNGVDSDVIKEVLKDKSTQPKNKYSMVYVSRFGEWSRAIETLQTVTELRKEFPKLELTLVGEGTETKNIQKFIEDNNAEDYIHYLGFIYDRKAMFSVMNQSAIGLNISDKNKWRDAAHPIKVIEYSALGKKVVSTNLDEVAALGYSNIFMFSDKNKRSNLKSSMRKALKAQSNVKDLKAISERVLNEYDWSKFTNTLADMFKTVRSKDAKPAIVHVTSSYPPNLGGLEKVVQVLARIQFSLGYRTSVITARLRKKDQETSEAFEITRLKDYKIANTTIMPGLLPKLLHIARNDIVHLHIVQAYAPEMVWLASKIRGFRYIAHIHLDVSPTGPAGFLLNIYKPLVLKRVLRGSSFVTVFTEDQKLDVHSKYGIELERIKVIPNGVGDEYFYDKQRILHKKPRLLFVGRLDSQKNLQLLLNALDGISEKFETTIVGDGSLDSDLKKLAKTLNLKNVNFVGRKDGSELLNYYKQSDIFVLPSEREGMPLVLLEAMAMGLPIVATDVTGSRDVVKNGKNGYLVPFDDATAFRSALLKITTKESAYKKLSQASRKMADMYAWEKISGQFKKLYKDKPVSPQYSEGVKLWYLLLPLLIIANASYLLKDFLGWIPTLCFFLFIPGFLLLGLLKHEIKSGWIIASFSLGLSLLLLMLGGLLLNSMHAIGLTHPLVTENIFAMLDIMTLILLSFNIRKPFKLPVINTHVSKELAVLTTLLTLLPLLAIGGAIRLNNGASNVLTMILFALIAILFVILASRKNLKPVYPYAIFMMSLAVLLTTSLRGWYITGHDIHHEFQVFQSTSHSGLWHSITSHRDPYSACLSITILPTILVKITSISAPYIFKVVFQIIFAFGVIPVYFFIKKLSSARSGFIGAFIFISFPPFLNDMPFLNRQEIAFTLFGMLMLTTFLKMARIPKTILTLLFLLGILLSHYSTNYVTLGLITFSWCFYMLLTFKRKDEKLFYIPLLSLPIIITALIVSYTWGSIITQTEPSIEHTTKHAVASLSKPFTQSSGVTYSLFSLSNSNPAKEISKYAGDKAASVHYSPVKNIPTSSLGKILSKLVNIFTLNSITRALIAKLYQILLIIGSVLLYIRQRNKAAQKDSYYVSLTLACVAMLVFMTLLPRLSVDYSVTRLFQQTLVIIALPIILATEYLFSAMGKFKPVMSVLFFSLIFLHLSGFIPQALGGYPPQMSLDNAGLYYDAYYQQKGEAISAAWLKGKNAVLPIAADNYSKMDFQDFPFQKVRIVDPVLDSATHSILFQRTPYIQNDIYVIDINGDVLEYSYTSPIEKGNILYENQTSRIFRN